MHDKSKQYSNRLRTAKLADYVAKIKSHIITVKQQEEVLRAMEIKNNMIEPIAESYGEIISETLKDASENEKGLKNLFELTSKGLEIYASIDAPKEAKNLFPQ